jgi:hypothetical protein
VHFKRWHPSNDYYGLSALQAARLAVASDQAMAEWNRNTFGKENGVPAGIVVVKEMVEDSDFERIKREWRASYGGPQRRTAFLRGGDIQWQNIGLSHADLDFLKGARPPRRNPQHLRRAGGIGQRERHRSQRESRRAHLHRADVVAEAGAPQPEDHPGTAPVLAGDSHRRVRRHPPDRHAGAAG